jgi:hypothetical protein
MKLPQKEFDLRLRTAGQEVLASANPARIVEAQYRATWNSGRLVGTAEWGLANSTPRPTAVPLDALRVAILAPRWADGRSAKIFRGTLAGRNGPGTYLWADDPAGGRIAFNWSARGIEELGEERIELGFPAVPVARLELTLPAERIPTSSTPGVLLTGPFPASNPRERLWRLTMGSLTRVVVALRLPLAGELSPPLRLLRTTRYSLGSGEVQANWDLQLASLRGAIREPRFEIDPGVRVVDVVSDAVEGWRFEPGATDDAPGQLAVRLREPTLSTRLQIVARQSLGLKNQTWTCPTIRASGELPGSETIQLTLVSPWTLERWTAGDFRLVQSEQMQNREHQLTWTSTATPNEDRTERKRPTVQIRPRESQFQTTETLNWRLEPGRNRLTARIQVQVQRGPIPALVMQLPAG